jgi:pimeloyl-ACP methyl ester carboxylesterase
MPLATSWALSVIVVSIAACAAPAEHFEQEALRLGLRSEVNQGTGFVHVVYRSDKLQESGSSRSLHVYLGGDGTPMWAGGPAADPTPRNPLVLRLLAIDPQPAIYLGRPCYHGLTRSPGCSGELWTTARYSEEVVGSLEVVVRRLVKANRFERISWFGYSGGGTLAMLLAERFAETQSVVTVAANLDIEAWAEHHDYAPLSASLNPASRPRLPKSIVQRYYVGALDRVVPLDIAAKALGLAGESDRFIVIADYDHVCCWDQIWPDILSELGHALDEREGNQPDNP